MPSPLVAVFAAGATGAFAKATAAFGEAICFIIVLHAASALDGRPFELKDAIAILTPVAIVSNALWVLVLRRDVDLGLLCVQGICLVVGALIGVQLLVRLEPSRVAKLAGCFFLTYSVARAVESAAGWARDRQLAEREEDEVAPLVGAELAAASPDGEGGPGHSPSKRPQARAATQLVLAALAGFFTGLCGSWFGVGGPPMMVYFSSFTHAKATIRANFIAYMLLLLCATLPTLLSAQIVQPERWPQYAACAAGMGAGSAAGAWLHRHVRAEAVQTIIIALLFCSAVNMIAAGDLSRAACVLGIATAAGLGALLALALAPLLRNTSVRMLRNKHQLQTRSHSGTTRL